MEGEGGKEGRKEDEKKEIRCVTHMHQFPGGVLETCSNKIIKIIIKENFSRCHVFVL